MGSVYKRTEGGKYYGEYTDAYGKRVRRSTKTTHKREALMIVAQWESEANAQRNNIKVPTNTALSDLLDEFITYLGNTTDIHKDQTRNRIQRVLDECNFDRAQQINQIAAENAVRGFLTPSGKRMGLQTQAHYLTALKAFTKWLTNLRGALIRDPLANVRKPNFQKDRKLTRRFLLPDEWQWLKLTPNALLYETAIQTGFRSSELRALKPANLGEYFVSLRAEHTKNAKPAKQYISEGLHARLKEALPFTMPNIEEVAKMVYADLELARALWESSELAAGKKSEEISKSDFLIRKNHAGDTLDFHALRHTCGAWLVINDVNIKVVQTVMRHSSITLTLDTYGHLMKGAEEDAVKHLTRLLG